MTPVQNPGTRAKNIYNSSQIRTRNVVERMIGVWKRRFPVLAYGTRCKIETTLDIIVATAVLQNIAVDMNEDLPLPPDELNMDEINHFILQGDIQNIVNGNENVGLGPNLRTNLINTHFANL